MWDQHRQHVKMASGKTLKSAFQINSSLDKQQDSDDDIFFPDDSQAWLSHPHTNGVISKNDLEAKLGSVRGSYQKDTSSFVQDVSGRIFDVSDNGARSSSFPAAGFAGGGRDHLDSASSIVDGLLTEIYDRWHFHHVDSDTFTESSVISDAFCGHRSDGSISAHPDYEQRHAARLHRAFLETKGG